MDFKLIHIFSENGLNAIGSTLFHSLWIGILLSLLTAAVMFVTRKSSASLRYQLLTGCLCLFVLAIGLVFYNEITKDPILQLKTALPINGPISSSLNSAETSAQPQLSTSIESLMGIWINYSAQIVLVWFLIICAKSIHLLFGLNTVFHLRRTQIFKAGKLWEEKLKALSAQLLINKNVTILQSGIAKVPMVIGHFKPIILIPLGLLNGMSTAEVESILCHELAHIKRKDYLVNILQSFIEVIFFFNPAVLWVSKLIKTERENCCDDLAITCVADKRNYIKALISCQEFQQRTPACAVGFTGQKGQLLQRVSRMLFNTKVGLNKLEKTILTLSIVAIFVCSAAFNGVQRKQIAPTSKQKNKSAAAVNADAEKLSSKPHFLPYLTNKELALNDSIFAKQEKKYAQAEIKYLQQEKLLHLDYKTAQDRYSRDLERYRQDSIRYAADAEKYDLEKKRVEEKEHYSSTTIKLNTDVKVPVLVQIVNKLTTTKKITAVDIDTNVDRDDLTDAINNELLKDGIITQTSKLTYNLNKKGLYVNGIKQPSALHAKYKSKYFKNASSALSYEYGLK